MRLKSWTVCIGIAVIASTAACEKASPARPSEVDTASATPASVTDARTGATIIAARPSAPASEALIRWSDQPITLSVTNATSTGSSPVTYTFEVAGDTGFARLDFSRADVPAGANGSTQIVVDKLGGDRDYFWRVRANGGSGTGPYSVIRTFRVGPEVELDTPVLASPVNGQRTSNPVSLVVNNVTRRGPAGPLTYAAQIATDPEFGNVVGSAEVAEVTGSERTSITIAVNGFADGGTYYWRVRASDGQNRVTSPYSATTSFVGQNFSWAATRVWDNPVDMASWPETARVTMVDFTPGGIGVDFDRRTGSNRWPDVVPPGWDGGIQYNQGICLNIAGEWNCSAVVEYWFGRDLYSSGPSGNIWYEWWYQPSRWGPMTYYRPREGETVGFFVAAGSVRHRTFTRATCPRVCEISNVVMVPWTYGYARYNF